MKKTRITTISDLIRIERFAHHMFQNIPRRSTSTGRPQTAWDHVVRVTNRFIGDYDLQAVAVLHDVIEDTPANWDQVRALPVTPAVYIAVRVLTHDKGEPYVDYIDRVAKNDYARRVKLADIGDNLSDSPGPHAIIKYSKALRTLSHAQPPVS